MPTPKQIARGLLRENRKSKRTWRSLGAERGVNHATLCRFAKSRGKWIPKDEEIQRRLGILKVRKPLRPKPVIAQRIENMIAETRVHAFGWKGQQ